MNNLEGCFWYLSLKFWSEYFFIRLLNSFPVLLVLFFFFASVIFISYLFLFNFWRTRLSPTKGVQVSTVLLTWPCPDLKSERSSRAGLCRPWSLGSLMPRNRQGHCTLPQGYSRLGHRQAGLPRQLNLSLTATVCTPARLRFRENKFPLILHIMLKFYQD